jgi:hypothetical protein
MRDRKVARTNIMIYLGVGLAAASMILRLLTTGTGREEHYLFWGGLLAYAGAMISDAITLLIGGQASVQKPSLADHFFPLLDPRPGHTGMVGALALLVMCAGTYQILFGR